MEITGGEDIKHLTEKFRKIAKPAFIVVFVFVAAEEEDYHCKQS